MYSISLERMLEVPHSELLYQLVHPAQLWQMLSANSSQSPTVNGPHPDCPVGRLCLPKRTHPRQAHTSDQLAGEPAK